MDGKSYFLSLFLILVSKLSRFEPESVTGLALGIKTPRLAVQEANWACLMRSSSSGAIISLSAKRLCYLYGIAELIQPQSCSGTSSYQALNGEIQGARTCQSARGRMDT